MMWIPEKCECGCDNTVTKKGNRFIKGHSFKNRNHRVDSIEKIREANTGKTPTKKTRLKMSKSRMGNKNAEGSKRTEEMLVEIRKERGSRGPRTEEDKLKISIAKTGVKRKPFTEEHINNLRKAMSGENHPNYGKSRSKETIAKISKTNAGTNHLIGRECTVKTRKILREKLSGENNGNWKGGITKNPYCPRFNNEVKEEIRNKYYRICFWCGKNEEQNNNRKLSVHHVDYMKEQGCDDHNWRLVPLCSVCHGQTNSGDRDMWENMLNGMLYISDDIGFLNIHGTKNIII